MRPRGQHAGEFGLPIPGLAGPGRETIPDAADGLHISAAAVRRERPTNALDRDVDCTHARATVTAPDVMQQSLAAVSTLGTAHQELEQLELHVAQRDRLVDD